MRSDDSPKLWGEGAGVESERVALLLFVVYGHVSSNISRK